MQRSLSLVSSSKNSCPEATFSSRYAVRSTRTGWLGLNLTSLIEASFCQASDWKSMLLASLASVEVRSGTRKSGFTSLA
jgi:hypothetical protein